LSREPNCPPQCKGENAAKIGRKEDGIARQPKNAAAAFSMEGERVEAQPLKHGM
jgi:hypothetical protein